MGRDLKPKSAGIPGAAAAGAAGLGGDADWGGGGCGAGVLPDAVGGRRERQAEPARALGRRETQGNSHSRETALRWGRGSVGGRGTQGSTED